MVRIVELSEGDAYRQLGNLADLLLDAVAGGASVSFMAGMTREEAEAFWEQGADGISGGRTHLFAALDGPRLIGAVLLHPAWQANQPHRADVAKLLVLRSYRRRGVATQLMDALETRAAQLGRTLLTLDTDSHSGAEPFYRARGYIAVGIIPGYALMPDATPCDTTIFFKRLAAPALAG